MSDSQNSAYRAAGVDVESTDELIRSWLPAFKRTSRPGVFGSPLGFGALFELPGGFAEPVLVSSTDGVGTKLKIAFELNCHDTVGIDLVAMCVNDVLVQGAEPLYFLDYFATGRVDAAVAGQVIHGIVKGCEIAGIALIGGETAEMPGMYSTGEYDLAGFAVGVVEKKKVIDGSQVAAGDVIVGAASSGVHSNGFSLIRQLLGDSHLSLETEIAGTQLGKLLLNPTQIYVQSILKLIQTVPVHALAHITGGGLPGNIARVMPESLEANLDFGAWPELPVFDWIQRTGNLSHKEMMSVFNCGIGMVMIVPPEAERLTIDTMELMGVASYKIGTVAAKQ